MKTINTQSEYFDLDYSEVVDLEEEDYKYATEMSFSSSSSSQKSLTYIAALALVGSEKWFSESGFKIDVADATTTSASDGGDTVAVCNLKINNFKCCLLPTRVLLADIAYLPLNIVSSPRNSAHFYIFTEVDDENEEVLFHGYIRYDKLIECIESNELTTDSESNYHLPLKHFCSDFSELRLSLKHLAPEAIKLPSIEKDSIVHIVNQKVINLVDLINSTINYAVEGWTAPRLILSNAGFLDGDNFKKTISILIHQKNIKIPLTGRKFTKQFNINFFELELYVGVWPVENIENQIYVLLILREQNDNLLPPGTRIKIDFLNNPKVSSEELSKSNVRLYHNFISEADDSFAISISIDQEQKKLEDIFEIKY